jgi:hypothetical protein
MSDKEITLNDLTEAVEKIKQRIKARYDLARELGFSAQESQILQNKSEETIRRLANERNTKEG